MSPPSVRRPASVAPRLDTVGAIVHGKMATTRGSERSFLCQPTPPLDLLFLNSRPPPLPPLSSVRSESVDQSSDSQCPCPPFASPGPAWCCTYNKSLPYARAFDVPGLQPLQKQTLEGSDPGAHATGHRVAGAVTRRPDAYACSCLLVASW